MSYQHAYFSVAAMLPLGDFLNNVSTWSGRSSESLLPTDCSRPTLSSYRRALPALRLLHRKHEFVLVRDAGTTSDSVVPDMAADPTVVIGIFRDGVDPTDGWMGAGSSRIQSCGGGRETRRPRLPTGRRQNDPSHASVSPYPIIKFILRGAGATSPDHIICSGARCRFSRARRSPMCTPEPCRSTRGLPRARLCRPPRQSRGP